jgi:hypothetical protein
MTQLLSAEHSGMALEKPKSSTELLVEKAKKGGQSFNIKTGIQSGGLIDIILDDVRFAIMVDDVEINNAANIDFSDYNLIVLSDITTKGNLKIQAINAYILKDINSEGNISFNLEEKLYALGKEINAQGPIITPPKYRLVLGNVSDATRLKFIEGFKEALRTSNSQKLIDLMTILLTYERDK